ncbi:MAG: response regulator, partial [bacterium]
AGKAIAREDTAAAEWTQQLFELGPWDKSLYDIIIPMHATSIDEAVSVICNNAAKPVVQRTPDADRAMEDFALESQVGIVMAQKGHDVVVTCEAGDITVVINRNVLRLDRLQRELEDLALKVEGVKSATTRVGPKFREPNIYFKLDAEMPSKILLVDDETEFVQTLSERLQSRNLPTAIAYNGKEALTIIENDEPEVVVLDLQMPGIHGIDVLRQAKKGHPNTEVIILTGHGSSKEEELAIELGAFAYLHKPVDIKVLSETMKDAYRKISTARADKESEGNDHE